MSAPIPDELLALQRLGAPGSHEECISVRPFPVIWRPRVELPSRDDAPMELLDAWEGLADADDRPDLDGFKAGLWIGDTGALYVGWSASEGWLVEWQCC